MLELLTIKEVSTELKVDEETVRRWLFTGKLKGIKLSPRAWRVHREDLNQFVNQTERKAG
jgi:excisionase family DNA binding protein